MPSTSYARSITARALLSPPQMAWWIVLCLLWLVGCTQAAHRTAADEGTWSGRIALQVEGQASQSFSAMFELQGNAKDGGLVLLSPLGNRIAQLSWNSGHAQLLSGPDTRSSESLEALLQDVTGTQIPVAALFDWLNGIQTTAPDWQADLSSLADGRLVARRNHPAPPATLRIVLTR